jgi:hypothetical protein
MKIFGQVLDSDNQPMSLADIVITTGDEANKLGEQSDLDGNFVLENELINPDSVFKVSYMNYVPQFLKASELQGKKIKLLYDIELVDDSIVMKIGEGKPKKNDTKTVSSKKGVFVDHLQKHRFIYGGIGALAGIILIVRAFKNKR